MKGIKLTSVSVFALSTLLMVGLNAQPRRGQGPGQGLNQGFGRANFQSALNLSEEQQDQMKTLRIEHQKAMRPLKNKIIELKAQNRTLMSESEVDIKGVNKNIDEQTALSNKIQKLQAEHKLAVREILTDEQEMMIASRSGKRGMPGYGRHSGYSKGQGSGYYHGPRGRGFAGPCTR
jgi:Spy/CpxP family protein refolding chaperone